MSNRNKLEFYIDCDRVLRFLAEKRTHATYLSYHIALHHDAVKVFGEKDIPDASKLDQILKRLRIDGYVYREGDRADIPSGSMMITPTGREFILRSSYEEREIQRNTIRGAKRQNTFNVIVGFSVLLAGVVGGLSCYLQYQNLDLYREEIELIKKQQFADSLNSRPEPPIEYSLSPQAP